MAEFFSWVQGNWASLIGALAAIVGVYISLATTRREARKDDRDEYATLVQQHKELWKEARERKELKRILLPDIDLKADPLRATESAFLNEVFIHYENGWKLALKNTTLKLETYLRDVRKFFSHPIPRAAWEDSKDARNPEFVMFIERAIERSGPLSEAGHCKIFYLVSRVSRLIAFHLSTRENSSALVLAA